VFQQLEVDYAMAKPHPVYYPTDLREVPVLRMFGVTEGGSSVAAFVHGFEPYFYAEAPTPTFSPDDCQALTGELNVGGPS
jgi:DNA polymerase delta subunit 1